MPLSITDLANLKRHRWHAQLFKSKLRLLNRRRRNLGVTAINLATVPLSSQTCLPCCKHKLGNTNPEDGLGAKDIEHVAK